MMVATLADTGTELLLTVEHDLVVVVLVDTEHEQVTPLLRATTELQQVIATVAMAGVRRAKRVLSAYVAARCILGDPPPKAKIKSMAGVISRLLRFEEGAAREPNFDRKLTQARATARGVKMRGLLIDGSLLKPVTR